MAIYMKEPSHTFGEYLLIPGYSSTKCIPANVSLQTPLVKYKKGEEPALMLNIPMTSAIMQSVSDDKMAVALAREGGLSFIYGSQSVESQAQMVARVKSYRAGFVISDSNISPEATLKDILALKEQTGHSTVAVTEDGSAQGKLVGLVTSRDYRVSRMPLDMKVREFMTPFASLITAQEDTSLKVANDIIWEHKLNCLPIINQEQRLVSMVFRKDYNSHKDNENELIDASKRYIVGAGINTRDYAERIPALLKAGRTYCALTAQGDIRNGRKLCSIMSGSIMGIPLRSARATWLTRTASVPRRGGRRFRKGRHRRRRDLHHARAEGIGRGQATALIEVAEARDEYFKETGVYVPICSDGGIVHDYHITLALAMGADFMMLGRYFARFDESPTKKVNVNGNYMKEYWGEGSARARNWQRYDMGGAAKLSFEEGVDSFVPYAGSLKDNVELSLSKVRSTMCNCGCLTIPELQKNAKITLISSTSIVEGGAHDVVLKESRPIL